MSNNKDCSIPSDVIRGIVDWSYKVHISELERKEDISKKSIDFISKKCKVRKRNKKRHE